MHTFLSYLLSVCATITIKMANRLTDKVFLNSTVTFTSKFQGQMINCLCLKNTRPDLHETKVVWFISYMTWTTDLTSDLGHEFPKSNLEIVISTKYLTLSPKNKDGWILWMVWYFVNNIWPTLCFHRMLQYRSGMTFLSLATSVWLYLYRNSDGVYLGHNACWGAVLGLTPYSHQSCMKFAKYYVTRTHIWCKLWSNLLRLFNNIWNADRLMDGWTDGYYTYDLGQKWNIVDE